MSAEVLREAAALMRERAEGATPGPWSEWAVQPPGGEIYNAVGNDRTEREICELARDAQGAMDSWHIASWHPAVALAVADWLDNTAFRIEHRHIAPAEWIPAVAVAHVYTTGDDQ